MDAFSYLSVLLSIILGLALTQLLQGLRGIALHRARVVPYWPVLAWVATLVLMFVQSWWAMFGLGRHAGWIFVQFFIVIVQTILLYLLAALILPDIAADSPTDLRAHYMAQRRLFMLVLVAVAAVSLLKDVMIGGHLPSTPNVLFHAGVISLAAIAAVTTREWYHKLLAVATLASFILYVFLLFSALGR